MPAETLEPRALNRATLARQLLLARERLGVVEAVERLGGLQAQEPKPPFVALQARLEGFAPDDLRAAIRAGDLVRGTLMRGTLHLASRRDFLALRHAVAADLDGVLRMLGRRADGLDAPAVTAAARALLAERPRTFAELRALLRERFPDVDHRALGYVSRMALPLTMVPTDDDRWCFPRDSAFALAADEPEPADDTTLVRRYLAAFGPATVADAQAWSGAKGLKPAFEALRGELATFADERGRELFDLPEAPRPGGDAPAPVRFLAEFDSLVLAHDDRSRLIDDEHRPLVTTKNLRVKATFLVDGRVAGTWTAARRRRVATLTLTPFARLPRRTRQQLEREAEPLLRLLEPEAETTTVVLGPD